MQLQRERLPSLSLVLPIFHPGGPCSPSALHPPVAFTCRGPEALQKGFSTLAQLTFQLGDSLLLAALGTIGYLQYPQALPTRCQQHPHPV